MGCTKGYTVSQNGEVFNPKGKLVHGRTRKLGGKNKKDYKFISVTNPENGYEARSIPVHRLVGYLKYGDQVFQAECVRHLNDNSLDNSFNNIEIGSLIDNHRDAVRNGIVQGGALWS
ncbi:HNH endonuclease [Staphylococcus phage MVC_VPHSA2]|nr:HNH endonuclease [Staphylococcus phage MVC_VPHSA2]